MRPAPKPTRSRRTPRPRATARPRRGAHTVRVTGAACTILALSRTARAFLQAHPQLLATPEAQALQAELQRVGFTPIKP